MPTYDFINTHTGEEWTEMMSIADMESLVEGNPEIKQAWNSAPHFAGDHIMGVGPKVDPTKYVSPRKYTWVAKGGRVGMGKGGLAKILGV